MLVFQSIIRLALAVLVVILFTMGQMVLVGL